MPKSSKQSFTSQFSEAFTERRRRVSGRIQRYLNRRPHRSFRRTRRRDYRRSLTLPGYWRLTREVSGLLWGHKKIFIFLGLVYGILTVLLIGLGSQETYATLGDTLAETSAEAFQGQWAQLGQAGLLFLSVAGSGLTGDLSADQQIYAALLFLMVWLTTVWLLRHILAGHTVRLRDGLYSAGAPLVSTFLVALVLVVQLLPLALAIIGFVAADQTGLLNNGIEAMLFWAAALLAGTLSLYWVTSTFFALIAVTLPGTYPMRALQVGGDMVIGRRVRILARLLWACGVVALSWVLILLPVILLDAWIKSLWVAIAGWPIVPVILLLLSVLTVIWLSSYVYILYRKVIDDDAAPA